MYVRTMSALCHLKFQAQILKWNRREMDIRKFVWERLWRDAIQQVLRGANFNIRWTDGRTCGQKLSKEVAEHISQVYKRQHQIYRSPCYIQKAVIWENLHDF